MVCLSILFQSLLWQTSLSVRVSGLVREGLGVRVRVSAMIKVD